jgi:integrase
VYGRTRKDVAEKLNKAIAERDAGLVFDAKNLSVGEYLDRWLDTVRGTLAPNTVRRHEELARIHVKPALGKTKLSKLDPLQVQAFYRSKLDDGLSAATVVKVHSTLSKALTRKAAKSHALATLLSNVSRPVTSVSPHAVKLGL